MRSVVLRLFNKRNLIALVAITVGLLGIFGVPQIFGFSTEQVLFGLTAFIALEIVIVNVGYLERLEEVVLKINNKMLSPGLDQLLEPKHRQWRELSDFTNTGQEVMVCGIALESIVMHQANLFTDFLKRRCRLKFVVTDPHVVFLDAFDYGMPNHAGGGTLKANIYAGLSRLAQLRQSVAEPYRDFVEVRAYSGIPFFSGVRIKTKGANPNTIWLYFYSYGGSVGERRGLVINSRSSPDTYAFYDEAFEKLWNGAAPLKIENVSSTPTD